MRIKNKFAIVSMTLILGSSFFIILPSARAASLEETIGHNFQEDYWSILYDFAGQYLEKDYNPGEHSDELTNGLIDNNTQTDSKFFLAYNKVQNVQTLYIAMQNLTWEAENSSIMAYGCAPYQILLQHFRPPGQLNYHVFIINTFLGLLAYRERNMDFKNDVPDEEDELYLGWSYYSEFHKALVNLILLLNGVPEHMLFDDSERTTAEPIPLEETEENQFKYGMSYKNVFILWQKINITEGLDDSVTGVDVINKCSAFALLSEINFTYVVKYQDSDIEGLGEVTTTTEYDIGEMEGLWVVGDSESVVDHFAGEYVPLTKPKNVDTTLGYYTGNALHDRIDGDENVPGFSLSVVNHANILVYNTSATEEGFQGAEFIDQSGNTLGASVKNITQAKYDFFEEPAYKIDFASKPDYLLNDADEYPSPVRVLKNDSMEVDLGFTHSFSMRSLLSLAIAQMTGSFWAGLTALFSSRLDDAQFFYLTCFPTWSGYSIKQDPTFSVYVTPPEDDNNGRRIPGFEPLLISLIGLCVVSTVVITLISKRRIKFI